jgi:hypothetical protein
VATTLKAALLLQLDAVYRNVLDLGVPTDTFQKRTLIELSNGTGSAAADLFFHDQRTLTASGTEDLDLAGGLTNPLTGAAMTFAEVRFLLVTAASTNTNNVVVSRPASNGVPIFSAAGDAQPISPGGILLLGGPADGKITVTAGTGDLITVTNSTSGSSVTYDVMIIGTSA